MEVQGILGLHEFHQHEFHQHDFSKGSIFIWLARISSTSTYYVQLSSWQIVVLEENRANQITIHSTCQWRKFVQAKYLTSTNSACTTFSLAQNSCKLRTPCTISYAFQNHRNGSFLKRGTGTPTRYFAFIHFFQTLQIMGHNQHRFVFFYTFPFTNNAIF